MKWAFFIVAFFVLLEFDGQVQPICSRPGQADGFKALVIAVGKALFRIEVGCLLIQDEEVAGHE